MKQIPLTKTVFITKNSIKNNYDDKFARPCDITF